MLIKEQPVLLPPRPRTFGALMELYETNYLQLRLLCGDLRQLPPERLSCLPAGIPVLLRLEGHSRHTTTLMLTYVFGQGSSPQQRPALLIRVYHDAQQAEVIGHHCRFISPSTTAWNDGHDSALQCRWRMNRFFFKWINYLHRQGHSFTKG